jgi:hypothetical protein
LQQLSWPDLLLVFVGKHFSPEHIAVPYLRHGNTIVETASSRRDIQTLLEVNKHKGMLMVM